jgi:O-antigen ligase
MPRLQRIAFTTALILPVMLLHARAGAEFCIAIIDGLFVFHLAVTRSWATLRQPWLLIALAWWAWEVICSLPLGQTWGVAGWNGLAEAVVLLRLIALAAALQLWLLTTPRARHAVWLTIALSTLWIGAESWQQYLTGHNLFGDHRWPDGSLTGPFWEPRAGAPYAHLLWTALLPAAVPLLNRKALGASLAAAACISIGIATSILIGQRMPTMLALLSLAISAFLLPRLRLPALAAIAAGAVLLALTPIISPPTYAKLVLHFIYQMRTFPVSPYGELYTRATTMGLASPFHGYGFNAFKTLCLDYHYATGFPALHIAPTFVGLGACNQHPHNFYLQAFTDAGLPGLALFIAMNAAWLIALSRGLWRSPDALRTGIFASVLTWAWPLASTDSFATLPHAGWLFLLLGLGLGCAQIPTTQPDIKNA